MGRIAPERLAPLLREEFMRGKKRGIRHLSGLVNWRRATAGFVPMLLPSGISAPSTAPPVPDGPAGHPQTVGSTSGHLPPPPALGKTAVPVFPASSACHRGYLRRRRKRRYLLRRAMCFFSSLEGGWMGSSHLVMHRQITPVLSPPQRAFFIQDMEPLKGKVRG